MKRRILTRVQLVKAMHDKAYDNGSENIPDYRDVEFSMVCHMIADGKTVKVYEDRDMGGTVVEYND